LGAVSPASETCTTDGARVAVECIARILLRKSTRDQSGYVRQPAEVKCLVAVGCGRQQGRRFRIDRTCSIFRQTASAQSLRLPTARTHLSLVEHAQCLSELRGLRVSFRTVPGLFRFVVSSLLAAKAGEGARYPPPFQSTAGKERCDDGIVSEVKADGQCLHGRGEMRKGKARGETVSLCDTGL